MDDKPQADDAARSRDMKKATLKLLGFLLMLAGIYFIVERATYYAIMIFTS